MEHNSDGRSGSLQLANILLKTFHFLTEHVLWIIIFE